MDLDAEVKHSGRFSARITSDSRQINNFRMYGATCTAWFDDIRLVEGGRMPWVVLSRDFTKALVLVKPYCGGPWDDASATEHALPKPMRPLQANGTIGDTVRVARLRAGEADIFLGD